eukprot:2698713-Rhodomonas_salina.2
MDGTDEGYAGGGGSAAVVRGWGRKIGIFYWNGSEGRNKKGFCTECRENLQVGRWGSTAWTLTGRKTFWGMPSILLVTWQPEFSLPLSPAHSSLPPSLPSSLPPFRSLPPSLLSALFPSLPLSGENSIALLSTAQAELKPCPSNSTGRG